MAVARRGVRADRAAPCPRRTRPAHHPGHGSANSNATGGQRLEAGMSRYLRDRNGLPLPQEAVQSLTGRSVVTSRVSLSV